MFLGAGATGALVASAVYAEPFVSGGNGAALGLLAAWAVPDLMDARAGDYYEGDLLGVAAIAALLLAMPLRAPGGELAGGRHGRGGRVGAGVRHVPSRLRGIAKSRLQAATCDPWSITSSDRETLL